MHKARTLGALIGALTLLATLAGCGDLSTNLIGRRFVSINELEVGLGPDGVELGHWSITFDAAEYHWSHSDMGESGSYTLTGTALSGDTWDEVGVYSGVYDPVGDRLTWEGEIYTTTSTGP